MIFVGMFIVMTVLDERIIMKVQLGPGAMKTKFQKLLCFIFGHKYYSVALNDIQQGGSSYFGTYKCQRCNYQEDWQYDL